MFDQPLWNRDATAWEKARNVIRDSMETVVPPGIGFAGLVTPEAVADYLPSFRWRDQTYAKSGKTSTGLQTREDPVKKSLRKVMSTLGVPLHELNLRNIEAQATK